MIEKILAINIKSAIKKQSKLTSVEKILVIFPVFIAGLFVSSANELFGNSGVQGTMVSIALVGVLGSIFTFVRVIMACIASRWLVAIILFMTTGITLFISLIAFVAPFASQ